MPIARPNATRMRTGSSFQKLPFFFFFDGLSEASEVGSSLDGVCSGSTSTT